MVLDDEIQYGNTTAAIVTVEVSWEWRRFGQLHELIDTAQDVR